MKVKQIGGLTIKHRTSAIIFEIQGNPDNFELYDENAKGPFFRADHSNGIPYYRRQGIPNELNFTSDEYKELHAYLLSAALEAWKVFTPKEADSVAADYDHYWDRDFEDEGSISLGHNSIGFSTPYQPVNKEATIRIFKFNKRKFESFIYDFNKRMGV